MDRETTTYILRIITTICGSYGLLYIVLAVGQPKIFLSLLALSRTDNRVGSRRHPWWLWPLSAFTFVCVGVVLYGALRPVIAAIPFSWGSHDDDGDWLATRDWAQMFGAFIGSLGVVGTLERVAEVLVWGPIERKARCALVDIIRLEKVEEDRVRKAAENQINKELGPEEREIKGPDTEWRDDLRQSIVYRLYSVY